jgi:Domain of unknown function (DUF4440)
MKIPAIFVAFLMFAPFVSAVAQAANPLAKPTTAFEQSLMTAEKSFIDAGKKGDTAFLDRTLTDDFSYVGSDGQLADRSDMIDYISGGGQNLLPYDMKVIPVSDSVGIVTYDVVVRVPPTEDQGPPPRYQHFSTVWVKQGDVWKMRFQQKSVSHWGDW